MKNRQFTKIAILALSLVLMIGAIFALTANAATKPEIRNMNVEYTDKFCLVYAVPADTVQGGSATLYIYDADPATGAEPIKDYTLKKTTPAGKKEVGGVGLDYEAYVFYTDGVAAMALDKVFYSQVVDAAGNKSDVKSYSVVQYLYTRLADVDGKANTIEQNELYEAVITFGTAAQKKFLKADVLANTTLISEYCYISAASGYTVEGKSAGVFPQNKPLAIAKDGSSVSGFNLTTYTSYDASEGAEEQSVTGSTLVVEDSNRVHVSAGAIVRTYKENVVTFEDETVGSRPTIVATDKGDFGEYFITSQTANVVRKYLTTKNDTVFGNASKVLEYAPASDGKGLFWAKPSLGLTGDEVANATGFEFSFDMRIDTSAFTEDDWDIIASNTAEGGLFNVKVWFAYAEYWNYKGMSQVYISILDDGKLQISLDGNNAKVVDATAFADGYNSFRFVVRVDEATGKDYIDIYVNNFSDTPDATFESIPTSGQESKINKVSDVDKAGICSELTVLKAKYYFDNIWCGYIGD